MRRSAARGSVLRPSRFGGARARLALLLILAAVVGTLPGSRVRSVAADSVLFARSTLTLPNGSQVRTRGYLDDHCVLYDQPCYSFGGGSPGLIFRPEGTGEARAIQRLAQMTDHLPHPNPDATVSSVQWEVAPLRLADPQPPITDSNVETGCGNDWRIDIMQGTPNGPLSIYEVESLANANDGRAQLTCYVAQAQSDLGVNVTLGNALVGWTTTFTDGGSTLFCEWANQQAGTDDGLILFAPQSQVPPAIAQQIPGCTADVPPFIEIRCRQVENTSTCLPAAYDTALMVIIMLVVYQAIKEAEAAPAGQEVGAGTARLRPFAQVLDGGGSGHYAVPYNVAQPSTMLMDYGDGTTDLASVAAGTGTVTFNHQFPSGTTLAIQRAEIAETGQQTATITMSDAANLPPGALGLPNPPACPQVSWSLSAGASHSLAITGSGDVMSWGANSAGQLGYPTTNGQPSPTPGLVPGLHSIVAVSATGQTSLALRSDGSVWSWGLNSSGQLGNGTTLNSPAPTLVGVLGAVSLSQGGPTSNAFAIKSDGTLWGWGSNSRSQLGDGTATMRTSPVEVIGISNVIAVAGGSFHTVALDSTGAIWGWGQNHADAVGVGGFNDTFNQPRQVLSGAVQSPTAGTNISATVMSDGSVWTWGDNTNDALGRFTSDPTFNPPGIVDLLVKNSVTISAGLWSMAALTTDGMVTTWGRNTEGELGIGRPDISSSTAPQELPNLTGVAGMTLGSEHALALMGDGTVQAWGLNSSGQLGTGQTGAPAFAPVTSLVTNVALPGGCVAPAQAAAARSAAATSATAGPTTAGPGSAVPSATPHPVPVPVRPSAGAVDPSAQAARRQALARDVRLAPGGISAAGSRG